MRYYLALDGGGSKLEAVLFDEELRLLSRVSVGGVNTNFVSYAQVEENCRTCYAELFTACPGCRLSAVIGVGLHDLKPLLDMLPKDVSYDALEDISEGMMGLLACGQYPDGIVILSGTGSAAFYIREGETADIIGGLGSLLGDDGSGYEIGREGLRAALAMEISGEKGPLLDEVRGRLGPGPLRDSLRGLYKQAAPVRAIASFSRCVGSAASRGDERACRVLTQAGKRLAAQAADLIRLHAIAEGTPLCVMGGSFKGHPALMESLTNELTKRCGNYPVKLPLFEPVVGAALYARVSRRKQLTAADIDTARRAFSALLL